MSPGTCMHNHRIRIWSWGKPLFCRPHLPTSLTGACPLSLLSILFRQVLSDRQPGGSVCRPRFRGGNKRSHQHTFVGGVFEFVKGFHILEGYYLFCSTSEKAHVREAKWLGQGCRVRNGLLLGSPPGLTPVLPLLPPETASPPLVHHNGFPRSLQVSPVASRPLFLASCQKSWGHD